MSRNAIRLQIISLDKQITAIEARQMNACYASAQSKPHEDMIDLFLEKDSLVAQKIALQERLAKPTFIQIITGGGKR